ncbi:putative F-box protein At1g53370 [Bidens hawaiensis]|uniref:putative F-box protein At1g53370 n=1 Tax=Bidens hawaiensis TaxID=980011 RepID=UPI00404924EF
MIIADQLPMENMYNILSRMSVKSLARMRCVSKQWCNYINDPYLESMHAKRATPTNPMLIMVHQFPSNHPNSQCILAFLEYKEKPGTCTLQVTKKPPVMEFMLCTELCLRYPNDIILGSCNGLLYSSQCNHDTTTTLVVINPLRKERYELPSMKITPIFHYLQTRQWSWGIDLEELSRRLCVNESSGLGFDDSTKTF